MGSWISRWGVGHQIKLYDPEATDRWNNATKAIYELLSQPSLVASCSAQLKWLTARIQDHQHRCVSAQSTPLHVLPDIACVTSVRHGGDSLNHLRHLLEACVCSESQLLPTIGQKVTAEDMGAMILVRALRDGRDLNLLKRWMEMNAQDVVRKKTKAWKAIKQKIGDEPPPNPSSSLSYISMTELRRQWRDTLASDELSDDLLDGSIAMMVAQGEIYVSCGLVFLNPAFATSLLKPLVDHRSNSKDHLPDSMNEHVTALHSCCVKSCFRRCGLLPD